VKVLERTTAGICLAIAQRVQQERQSRGDAAGAEAARQVALVIEEEFLKPMG
jgi:hypothetical protein